MKSKTTQFNFKAARTHVYLGLNSLSMAVCLLLLMNACKQEEPVQPFDTRNLFVGLYSVTDSMYTFEGKLDSFDFPVYEFKGVFHHPKVELSKTYLYHERNQKMEWGIHYKVLEADTCAIDKFGARGGQFTQDIDFYIASSNLGSELYYSKERLDSMISGRFIFGKLYLSKLVWGKFYSVARLDKIQ